MPGEPRTTEANAGQAWPRGARIAAAAIVLLGVAWTLQLSTQRSPGVFYAGDGGLKALWIEQAARGEWSADLRLPAEPWAETLWERGLYPFAPNFVWTLPDGLHYLSFPLPFLAASTPGYALFGHHGLYLWPLLSVWTLWIAFAWLAARWRLDPLPSLVVLAGLIFASPLTLYGILFWEHAPAAALSFAGVVGLIDTPRRPAAEDGGGRRGGLLGAGALLGSAAWLRPECAVMAVACLAVAAALARDRRGDLVWAVVGAAIPLALFAALNLWLYGTPLGAHSLQMLAVGGGGEEPKSRDVVFLVQLRALAQDFPLSISALIVAGAFWAEADRGRREVLGLLAACAIFFVGTSLIVPNGGGKQWGPRYLMPLVPVFALVTLLALHGLTETSGRRRSALALGVLVAPAIALGVWRNVRVGGPAVAREARATIAPALELVQRTPGDVVVVDHQYAAMALPDAFASHRFFWPKSREQMAELVSTLVRNDRREFLLIRLEGQRDAPPVIPIDDRHTVHTRPTGPAGRFQAWNCRIEPAG